MNHACCSLFPQYVMILELNSNFLLGTMEEVVDGVTPFHSHIFLNCGFCLEANQLFARLKLSRAPWRFPFRWFLNLPTRVTEANGLLNV